MIKQLAKSENIFGIVLLLSCLYLFGVTFDFPSPLFEDDGPGLAFFPQLLTIGGACLAVLMIVQSISAGDKRQEDDGEPIHRVSGKIPNSWLGIALTCGYLAALYINQYFIATPVFVAGMLWLCGIRGPAAVIGVSLGFTGFIYGVFYYLLSVPLTSI